MNKIMKLNFKKLTLVLAFTLLASCTSPEGAEVAPSTTTTTVASSTTTTVADTTTTTVADTTTTTVSPSTTTPVSADTVNIKTNNVDCTIPPFFERGYKKNYYELSTTFGYNIPKENAEMCILYSESIPNDLRVYQSDIMNKLIKYVGGYDRWTHIMYEPDDQALEAIDALDKFDFFYDNNGQRIEPSLQFVHENRSCLSGFGRKQERYLNEYSICIQPNPLTDPYWEFDRKNVGDIPFRMMVLHGLVHEYYHHVQRAHTFERDDAMPNDCCGLTDPLNTPAWYVEGQAIVFPNLFIRDNFDDLQIVKDNGFQGICDGDPSYDWDTLTGKFIAMAGCHFTQKYFYYRQEVIGESEWGECRGFTNKEEYRDTALCAGGWEMINFYIAYLTSFETLFIRFHEDIYELAFEETLKKHTGMYSDELYVSFNNFILDNPTPPEGFFPDKPLNELVNFWSIDSSN